MQTDRETYPPVDFLAVGHVCRDLIADGTVIGGAAAYSASVARVLGCRSGIVTSGTVDSDWCDELAGITTHLVSAPATTVFENVYTPAGRVQTIHAVAGNLAADHVPLLWTRTPIVFIGPIANEIDPGITDVFSNSLIGVGPQGWMRRWDERGHIFQVDWESAAEVLPNAAVTFLSVEDLPDQRFIEIYARLSRVLVITGGPDGCKVYSHHEARHFPAPSVRTVDSTGAGDIFAAAYLVRMYQTDGNIWEAAVFANRIAACSVTQQGLPAKMEAIRKLLDGHYDRPPGTARSA